MAYFPDLAVGSHAVRGLYGAFLTTQLVVQQTVCACVRERPQHQPVFDVTLVPGLDQHRRGVSFFEDWKLVDH